MKYIAELFYTLAYIFTLPSHLLTSIGNWFMAYEINEDEEDEEEE